MNDLGTALRQLAGQAVAPHPVDAEGLWRRGRARAVRRRLAASSVVATVAAALIGFGTYVVVPRSAVVPADGRHAPALPKNVWAAPSWLPSTADGAPGTVAAIGVPASGKGRFVISAETGEYRLLDLPGYLDFDSEYQLQLSPDGNHIAYWYRADGRTRSAGVRSPTGLALYDTRTGQVTRWPIPVPAGKEFLPFGTQSILWLGRNDVGFYGVISEPSAKGRTVDFIWQIDQPGASGTSTPLPPMGNIGPPNLAAQVLGLILRGPARDWRRYGYIDASGQIESGTTITLPKGDGDSYYGRPTRQGTTVLVEPASGPDPESLDLGRVEADGTVPRLEPVDDLQGSKVLGWTASNEALVLGTANAGDKHHTLALYNVADRHLTTIGSADGAGGEDYTNSGGTPDLQIATDLLGRPMVTGVHPRWLDPRLRIALFAGGAVGVVAAAARILLVRRQRG